MKRKRKCRETNWREIEKGHAKEIEEYTNKMRKKNDNNDKNNIDIAEKNEKWRKTKRENHIKKRHIVCV